MNKVTKLILHLALPFCLFLNLACNKLDQTSPEAAIDFFLTEFHAGTHGKARQLVTDELNQYWDRVESFHTAVAENTKLSRIEIDKVKYNETGDRAKLRVRTVTKGEYGQGHRIDVYLMVQRDDKWLVHNYGMDFNQEPPEVEKDQAGFTPYDYALKYFEAMNREDLQELRRLHSEEFMNKFCSSANGVDEDQFVEIIELMAEKTVQHGIHPDSGHISDQPDGYFPVLVGFEREEEFLKEKRLRTGMIQTSKHSIKTLSFKKEEGLWKIASYY